MFRGLATRESWDLPEIIAALTVLLQTQPKREAWCNIIYTHIILPFILYLCYLSQLSWVKSSKIPSHAPTWPLLPFRLHHQPQPCLVCYCTFPFIIPFIQRPREALPEGLGSRAEEPDMGRTSTKAALSPWGLLNPTVNIPTCCLHRICILQSFPS